MSCSGNPGGATCADETGVLRMIERALAFGDEWEIADPALAQVDKCITRIRELQESDFAFEVKFT